MVTDRYVYKTITYVTLTAGYIGACVPDQAYIQFLQDSTVQFLKSAHPCSLYKQRPMFRRMFDSDYQMQLPAPAKIQHHPV